MNDLEKYATENENGEWAINQPGKKTCDNCHEMSCGQRGLEPDYNCDEWVPMQATCGGCRWRYEVPGDAMRYQCRYSPPTCSVGSLWPFVEYTGSEWCSKWSPQSSLLKFLYGKDYRASKL